jgi:hypothetical protein
MTRSVRIHEFGDAEVLRIEDAVTGEPAAGEIRLRVHAIGLNRTEVTLRSGRSPAKPALPSSIGFEAAGVIEAFGPDVSGFAVGDRGPGLRWGTMGSLLLNHLGGGEGGIEHFFQQFTGPMTAWWKALGQPVLTPEVQKKIIDSVHAEVGSRSIDELAAERDEMLLGLIELRAKVESASAPSKAVA